MITLKNIRLVNFGGYRDTTFNFDAVKNPIALFYAPNGLGKTTVLEAVRIMSNPNLFKDRDKGAELYLKPLVYDNDYQNGVANVKQARNELFAHAIFDDDGVEKNVVLGNEGFLVNELDDQHRGYSYFVDADNTINWSNFQLHSSQAQQFIEMAESIYGFECDLDQDVKDQIKEPDGSISTHTFYQDLIILKGKDRVHFCRMSAGEKKIATLIRQLCDPDNLLGKDIILIDNADLHVYFSRHSIMIDMFINKFKGKQFLLTAHSHDMITYVGEKYGSGSLYDVAKIKGIVFKDQKSL